MKTTKEMIEVMQADEEGKIIEKRKYSNNGDWVLSECPLWNWDDYDYRIKPEPVTRPMTLDEIIEWRKNSNGVILWEDEDVSYVTVVDAIDKNDIINTFRIAECRWVNFDDFSKYARKPDRTKFEVEDETEC